MRLLVSSLDAVAERVGLAPTSPLLLTALTHSSYAGEHDVESNERLEFLGDAVVDLAIADLIVTRYPELDEGTGSLVRSRVVNEAALAEVATRLGLGQALRVGRGVKKEQGTKRPSLLADAFEAVVAAIYLERGYGVARAFVHDALADEVHEASEKPGDVDPKTQLRQWAQANGLATPTYDVTAGGPSHDATFVATVRVGELIVASGEGRSKKSAEGRAALAAWERHLNA
ncbi:MAG TPA: ribonuclease III [Acidimicrobiales bacterium]|nr:ribonuclease III [Acidimicrobiales bacterium]